MLKHLVIGMGSIGKRHYRLLKEVGEDVIGIDKPTINPETMNIPSWNNYDMVWICTPTKTHFHYAMEAIKQGKKVFIEKPLTADLEEAEQIKNAMDTHNNHKVWVACNYRFHPAVKTLKENFQRVGDILYSNIHYSHYLPYQRENWKEYIKDTDIIKDAGWHFIDLALWLFGKKNSKPDFKIVKEIELGITDKTSVFFEHVTKVYTQIDIDYLRRDKSWGIEVVGDNGSIELISKGEKPCHIELKRYYDGEGVDCFTPTWTLFDNDEMYRNQLDCLLKENWQSNINEAIEVMKICA